MHHCLNVDEIIRLLARTLVDSGAGATAVSLARCCKSFEDPVLDALWVTQDRLLPLLRSLPGNVWKVEADRIVSLLAAFGSVPLPQSNCSTEEKSSNRIPTEAEWSRFRKYARGMRELKVDASQDLVTPDVLLALQLRAGNDHLFPRLRTFVCEGIAEGFIPSIPLFLSSNVVSIRIQFVASSPTVRVASTIARVSLLCPNLECITILIHNLPRHPFIAGAVSEMLLACNRDTLRQFMVNSPLTEEARRVLYQLPRLSHLSTTIQGPTSLPPVKLPNLIILCLEYDHGHEWLKGFSGAALGKLKTVSFYTRSGSAPITNFLEELKTVALTTSTQNTLSYFYFRTLQPWNPNYSSLLVFKHLIELVIEFSCRGGCSSRVDDNTVISLAEEMPKLKILQLGRPPCRTITGVTFKGLVALACRCIRLSKLCIHFRAHELVEATAGAEPSFSLEPVVLQTSCALTDLRVGETPIPPRSTLAVSMTLLQIFPQIRNVEHTNPEWKGVADAIRLFRRIGRHVHHASKPHLSRPV